MFYTSMVSNSVDVEQALQAAYLSQGGIKAVVWTDVIQIILMIAAILLIAIKGTMDVDGIKNVIQRNLDSGRIEPPKYT